MRFGLGVAVGSVWKGREKGGGGGAPGGGIGKGRRGWAREGRRMFAISLLRIP